MSTVNMLDAKSNLSRLVEEVEAGVEAEIIIARNGKPVAKLAPIDRPLPGLRLGVAKGAFLAPEPDEALDAEIEKLFAGGVEP